MESVPCTVCPCRGHRLAEKRRRWEGLLRLRSTEVASRGVVLTVLLTGCNRLGPEGICREVTQVGREEGVELFALHGAHVCVSNEWEEKGWVGMRPSWPIFQSSYSVAGRLITTIVPDPLPDQAHRLFGFLAYPATPDAP